MKSIHLIIFYCFSMFFLRSQENINNDIEFNGFFDFKYEDFSLEGYDPYPLIKAPVAV